MFTTSNGTKFELSNLYGEDIENMHARDFAAALFKSNTVIPWRKIDPTSLNEIRVHLKHYNPTASKGNRKGKKVCTSILLYITVLSLTNHSSRRYLRNGGS